METWKHIYCKSFHCGDQSRIHWFNGLLKLDVSTKQKLKDSLLWKMWYQGFWTQQLRNVSEHEDSSSIKGLFLHCYNTSHFCDLNTKIQLEKKSQLWPPSCQKRVQPFRDSKYTIVALTLSSQNLPNNRARELYKISEEAKKFPSFDFTNPVNFGFEIFLV